jgi:hypothetical protein
MESYPRPSLLRLLPHTSACGMTHTCKSIKTPKEQPNPHNEPQNRKPREMDNKLSEETAIQEGKLANDVCPLSKRVLLTTDCSFSSREKVGCRTLSNTRHIRYSTRRYRKNHNHKMGNMGILPLLHRKFVPLPPIPPNSSGLGPFNFGPTAFQNLLYQAGSRSFNTFQPCSLWFRRLFPTVCRKSTKYK